MRTRRRDGDANRHGRQPRSGAQPPGRPACRGLCSRRRPQRRRMGIADRRNHMRHASDVDPFRRDRALETARRNRVFCVLRHVARRNLRASHPRPLGRGERESLGPRRDARRGRQPHSSQSGRHGAPAFASSQHRQSKRSQEHRPGLLDRSARSCGCPLISRTVKSVEQPWRRTQAILFRKTARADFRRSPPSAIYW